MEQGPAATQSSCVEERLENVFPSPGCVTSMRTVGMDPMRRTVRRRRNVL